jgi:hypothetical protein
LAPRCPSTESKGGEFFATVLTGDPEFDSVEHLIKIRW